MDQKTVLVLRCCAADGTSRNGFKWPGVGKIVTAPDWKDNGECGHGLHGWLYGQGDHSVCDYWDEEGALWLVVEVAKDDIRMLGGKCKFQSGTVRFSGAKHEAAEYLISHEPQSALVAVIGRSATVGEKEIANVGDRGTATAGEFGTICIKYWDVKCDRYRTVVGYVGEDGIEANTAYRLDADHKFAKVSP